MVPECTSGRIWSQFGLGHLLVIPNGVEHLEDVHRGADLLGDVLQAVQLGVEGAALGRR
tara:strand:- start:312 stop:488 length:177 start_codon:yes stop_codon:yes gene_type:complete